ncbi:ER membrane protein complex subunit 4-like [Lineus longissimus]|uniref:ER membrane protein complex subunit 4-like n=1 Tax=Lineus longissimus TaxID=88925 RepID=UPI002B4E54A4
MASSSGPVGRNIRKSKWAIDFSNRSRGGGDRQLMPVHTDLTAPLGYSSSVQGVHSHRESDADLLVKRSWDVALGPIKQVPMNLFIMWMAGSTIGIFPIMMVGMMFIRPIQAMMGAQQTFKMIEGNQQLAQRFVYLLGNVLCVLLAVYKCHGMGILPTHASDWLAFVEPQKRLEYSGGGMLL